MDDEEVVDIILFLSRFCKFSIYGERVILNVNGTYFHLSDTGIAQVEAERHDYAVRYSESMPKKWDEIITRIRNGQISVLDEHEQQLRARTVINKILTQFF